MPPGQTITVGTLKEKEVNDVSREDPFLYHKPMSQFVNITFSNCYTISLYFYQSMLVLPLTRQGGASIGQTKIVTSLKLPIWTGVDGRRSYKTA